MRVPLATGAFIGYKIFGIFRMQWTLLEVGSYTEWEIMLFSELRLQHENIAYRVVGKPKNAHPEHPVEWPPQMSGQFI